MMCQLGRFMKKSKKYARQACYLYNYFQDTIYEATMTFTMALTCTEMLEFDSASYYNKKALELLGNRQDNESLGYKASIYLDEGYNIGHEISITGNESRRLESIHWYLEGLRISEKIENPMLICLFLSNLSYAYSTLGSDDSLKKGIDFAHRLLSISENLKIRLSLILHAYKRLAIIEYENGNVKEAIYLLNEGLQKLDQRMKSFSVSDYPSPQTILWDRHYYLVELKRAYKFFYSIYLEQKDFEKALEYYILMDETETEIRQKDNQNLVVMLEAEYKNEKTESRIAGLEKEREISELRASQSRYFNIGLGIFIIVLLLVSLLFIRQNKIKNEHRSTLLEQKLLRLQMNPHFIFNALSSIHSLMNPKDVGRASAYLGNFSSLLRSTLESSREDYILLEEEISAIRNYLELQSMRFHNKFKYTIDVDPGINLEAAIIPPMLIQPFIENAIEHGIRNKQDKGQVNVRFRLQQNMIICEIEDDGVGRKKAWETAYTQKRKHRSLATDIIHERIRILNRKFRLKIDLDIIDLNSGSGRPSGTLVKLDLPYILD